MTALYVPVLRFAVIYAISSGRRWSVLEHMLLVDLCREPQSVSELASAARLPTRMVVEGLIALLRSNWVEVRADASGVRFAATEVGRARSGEDELPAFPHRDIRWTSMCYERLTGSWLRTDDLKLVYEEDLPDGAEPLPSLIQSHDTSDGLFRELLPLAADENLEPEEPRLKQPSRPFVRFDVLSGEVAGLPLYAASRLKQALLDQAPRAGGSDDGEAVGSPPSVRSAYRDTISSGDVIVGGDAHLALLRRALSEARSTVVIHSCFVHPAVIERLLPDFEAAARRKVRVELLWGLRGDSESGENPPPIRESEAVIGRLTDTMKARVRLAPSSSGSHAKVLLWDAADGLRTVIGSCNWLSSYFDADEVSVVSRSRGLASAVLSWLVTAQLPAAGGWSAMARRLNRLWNEARKGVDVASEQGEHELELAVDDDHLALIREARNSACGDIVLGCDIFGQAAETSALVPLESAARLGKSVTMFYRRPSKRLRDEGRAPDPAVLRPRGLILERAESLHGKFMAWDASTIVVSSFNWLSTVPDTRPTGAELGLVIRGPGIRALLAGAFGALGGESPVASALLPVEPNQAGSTSADAITGADPLG